LKIKACNLSKWLYRYPFGLPIIKEVKQRVVAANFRRYLMMMAYQQ
jgi:hypothetical protein